jgi:PAS domain S-box-containing protein
VTGQDRRGAPGAAVPPAPPSRSGLSAVVNPFGPGSVWAVAGIAYAGAYAALMVALDGRDDARLIAGNIGLLLPPLAPMYVLGRRRRDWHGHQAVFFGAIGAWAALWFVGQIGWAADELILATPLPWFSRHIILQLSGSALPVIALVARPHRAQEQGAPAVALALDVAVLTSLIAFVYWSLIIVPGLEPSHSAMALRSLATIGPLVRLAAVVGLLLASIAARGTSWELVYRQLAYGFMLAFGVLVMLSLSTLRGSYQTGSPADVGWMVPFWFAAWAAAAAPSSVAQSRQSVTSGTHHSSPALLFGALLAVPLVVYSLRFLMPLSEPLERLRELAAAGTLVVGIALVMLRLRVEQRAVEQANQRVRLLATACEQAGELVVIISRDNRIEYANDAFCHALGYECETLAAVPPEALVAPESAAQLAGLRETLRAREIARLSVMLARRDGTTFQAACVAAPIVDAANRVTHFVVVIRDITDEVRLREQLVRGERLSALGEFVSGVAHEVNNPLQSVIGTLDLVLGADLPKAVRADLERMRFEAGRAGRIVRNLLMFVRPSSSERLLCDLNEIVMSTVGIRTYELELAGIQVRQEYAPVLPLVLANRDEIQQVLLNLIINAQQAMSVAGVRVLSVRTLMARTDAVVEVRDTGPGMAPEMAARIFEPFVSTKSAGGAPGLGLSLSFGIARSHHGTLELLPTEPGCCFRLTLPGAGFPGPASVHPPSPAGIGG